MTRPVSEGQAREWLEHPLTQHLRLLSTQRRDQLTAEFLSGRQLDPLRQGQAMAHHWVCRLLDQPPDRLMAEMDKERSK